MRGMANSCLLLCAQRLLDSIFPGFSASQSTASIVRVVATCRGNTGFLGSCVLSCDRAPASSAHVPTKNSGVVDDLPYFIEFPFHMALHRVSPYI